MRHRRLSSLLLVILVAPAANAHVPPPPPPQFPVARPAVELSSWIGLGGGVRVTSGAVRGAFDLRLGGDATVAIARDGDLRAGPFVEVGSATFTTLTAIGGVEVFVGAAPRPLRVFQYPGEGHFVLRLGAGWSGWTEPRPARSSVVTSITIAYGYRAPFSLREPSERFSETPGQRAGARYMIPVRFWTNVTLALASSQPWQVTGGIEFEPVGSFRYLLGIY